MSAWCVHCEQLPAQIHEAKLLCCWDCRLSTLDRDLWKKMRILRRENTVATSCKVWSVASRRKFHTETCFLLQIWPSHCHGAFYENKRWNRQVMAKLRALACSLTARIHRQLKTRNRMQFTRCALDRSISLSTTQQRSAIDRMNELSPSEILSIPTYRHAFGRIIALINAICEVWRFPTPRTITDRCLH